MSRRTITLDQLIALNDELAALVRMGVPLDLGLKDLHRDLPGRLGRVVERLRERIASGQSLEQVVAESSDIFPAPYQAMIRAGIKSARLSAALEGASSAARRIAQTRRRLRYALVYPILLLVVGYLIIVYFTVHWPAEIIQFRESSGLPHWVYLDWLAQAGLSARLWAPWPPVVLAIVLVSWWIRSYFHKDDPSRGLRQSAATATFAELLAAMVQQGVVLDEAISLAADASGSHSLTIAARQWVDRLHQGKDHVSANEFESSALSGWLVWIIGQGAQHADLAGNLRHAARVYRDRMLRQLNWYSNTLPVLVTLSVGIAVILILLMMVFFPFYHTLYSLTRPYMG